MDKNEFEKFQEDINKRVKSYQNNEELNKASDFFIEELSTSKYAYNFYWLGVPIIQIPQDIQALQEIIWATKPDLIIETGIAWGGSLIFSASMLAILEVCGLIENGLVVGVDIEIRDYNRTNINNHPLNKKIKMIEESSIDDAVIKRIMKIAKNKKRIMVCLDSNHTHEHVLAELKAYAPFITVGNYIMVGDTGIEDLPEGTTSDRPWGKGNNPKTAIWEFLRENKNFIIDKNIDSRLLITGSKDGYLKRVK